MKTTLRVKRVSAGIYDVIAGERQFEIERYPDGSWLLFEGRTGNPRPREYLNDFATKRAAVQSAMALGRGEKS